MYIVIIYANTLTQRIITAVINIDLCLWLHTICDTAANEYMQLAFRLDAIIW